MSKNTKSRYGRKKTMRSIWIAVITVLVIAAAVFLIICTQKDGAGMNCFRRSATAATADGVKVTMGEYRVGFDTLSSSYQTASLTEDQIRNLQENAAKQVLQQKIYAKEAKALGLSLTEEQKTACEKSAQNQIDSIESYYRNQMVQGGSYSKAALDKQMTDYFQHLGMSRDAYRAFMRESAEAEYYRRAIDAYYKEKGIDEAALLAFYRKSVEESMTMKDADGKDVPTYGDGDYWYYMMLYSMGYSTPMLYVPEGFIYIDYIELQKSSTEEATETVSKVTNGEISFDELMASDENKDSYRRILKAPYPIAEKDHAQLFKPDEVYTMAEKLQVGEIGSFIADPVTADDGTQTVTAYLFRRAEGKMCMDGDSGVINIDYFDGVRDSAISEFIVDPWFSDVKYEDALYAYKGVFE